MGLSGEDAFINIKYVIPTYESAVLCGAPWRSWAAVGSSWLVGQQAVHSVLPPLSRFEQPHPWYIQLYYSRWSSSSRGHSLKTKHSMRFTMHMLLSEGRIAHDSTAAWEIPMARGCVFRCDSASLSVQCNFQLRRGLCEHHVHVRTIFGCSFHRLIISVDAYDKVPESGTGCPGGTAGS